MQRRRHADREHGLYAERTTLRTWLAAIAGAAVGVGLLYVATVPSLWMGLGGLQVVIEDVGALLLASVAIALIADLGGRRAFVDELLAKVHLAADVVSAGIVSVSPTFQRGISWEDLFQDVEKLDIFFAYGRTWRNTHHEELKALCAKRGVRIRVVLPDPDDDVIVADLARRFGYSPEVTRNHIHDAEQDFRRLRESVGSRGATVSLWFLMTSPQFTMYRFDRTVILALYSHRHDLTPVPTFTLRQGGSLTDFVRADFDAMIEKEQGLARLAWEISS